MFLQWTSSVNQETIPNSTGLAVKRKTIMQAHVWNLYSSLVTNGWQPVSSSFHDGTNYQIGSAWSNSSSIQFPLSMSSWTENETLDSDSDVYTPTEHSWVTLSRDSGDAVNDKYFITIDCRYPLPPHKSNTSTVVDKNFSENNVALKYNVKNVLSDDPTFDLFVGTAGMTRNLNIPVDIDNTTPNILSSISFDVTKDIYFNRQPFDLFKGVAFKESDNNLKFDTNVNNNVIKYQDYISRCVAFVDLVFHKGDETLIKQNIPSAGDPTYESATTKVRPKASKDDNRCWYNCWGFDYLEINEYDDKSYGMEEDITAERYKYAFHHKGNSGIDFIYQIYNKFDDTFRSSAGLLSVKNRSEGDIFSHVSMCVNANPEKYYNVKNINYNSAGTSISHIKTATVEHKDHQINNFYNTCFRNYNFSDGITSLRAGNLPGIGKTGKFPAFAPVKPSQCSVYSGKLNFASCSFSELESQITQGPPKTPWIAYEPSVPASYNGSDTDKIVLKSVKGQAKPNTNNTHLENGKFEYKVQFKPDNSIGKTYQVYYYSIQNSEKKLAFTPKGDLFKITLQDALSGFSGQSITNFIPPATFPGDYVTKASFHESLNITETKDKLEKLPSTELADHFAGNTGISDGCVELYIGNKDVGFPIWSELVASNRPTKPTAFGSKAVLDSNLIEIIKSTLGISDLIDKNGNTIDFGSTTDKQKYIKCFIQYLCPDYKIVIPTNKTGPGVKGTLGQEITTFGSVIINSNPNPSSDKRYLTLSCFIRVPIEDLYNFPYTGKNSVPMIQNGNFNSGSNPLLTEHQDKGTNYFSVFKTCNILSTPGTTVETPLAVPVYTFSKNLNELSDKTIFGTVNLEGAKDDEVYLADRDENGMYTELPIFLFSLKTDQGKLKGYIPDISFAPGSVKEATLIKYNSTNFKKVYWGGCWLPWVTDQEPDLGKGS